MISMEGFVKEEEGKWAGRKVPMSLEALETELQGRMEANGG